MKKYTCANRCIAFQSVFGVQSEGQSLTCAMATDILNILHMLARAGASDELLARAVRELLAVKRLSPPVAQEKAERALVAVKVHLADGRRTNVSLPIELLGAACRFYGSESAARRKVRELARQAPPETTNRSGWVQDALARILVPTISA